MQGRRHALDLYGISAELIARLTGAHPDTARRWKRAGNVPAAVAPLLELRLAGELGLVDATWRGFRLVRGQLWTPEGSPVTPGDVRAIPYRRAQLAELERLALEPRQWELFSGGAPASLSPRPCACEADAPPGPLGPHDRAGARGLG